MSAEKGNNYAKGNKGGGRKSMLDEWVQAQVRYHKVCQNTIIIFPN